MNDTAIEPLTDFISPEREEEMMHAVWKFFEDHREEDGWVLGDFLKHTLYADIAKNELEIVFLGSIVTNMFLHLSGILK